MAEAISRAGWLRLEIAIADDYTARHATDPDPITNAQLERRRREAADHRAELAVWDAAADGTLIGAYVRIRHRGPHGVTLIESFVTDLDDDGGGVEVSSHPSFSFALEEVTLLDDGPSVTARTDDVRRLGGSPGGVVAGPDRPAALLRRRGAPADRRGHALGGEGAEPGLGW